MTLVHDGRVTRDLFKPIGPLEKTHHLFQRVLDYDSHQAARRMMNEVFGHFRDVDKNFIRDFQTAGFSARVFELALFAYLMEEGCTLDRSRAAPDFYVEGKFPVAIEATTTNQPQNVEPDDLIFRPPTRSEIMKGMDTFAFQLNKALYNKLLHTDAQARHYWELPHMDGIPFVVAVGAFHGQHAQVNPMALAAEYLYGMRAIVHFDSEGNPSFETKSIGQHKFGGRVIPSGFFRQPEAANIAGVLFSNAHTVAIFNRAGTERGYGSSNVAMCRLGVTVDPTPSAIEPALFGYVVGEEPPGSREPFAAGLHLFINPWSIIPVSAQAFPSITYHELLEDGTLMSIPSSRLQPIFSKTEVWKGEHAHTYAMYRVLRYLGRIPAIEDP